MIFGKQVVAAILSSVIQALLVLNAIFRRLCGLSEGDAAARCPNDNQSSHPATAAEVNGESWTNDSTITGDISSDTYISNDSGPGPTTTATSSTLGHSEAETGQSKSGTLKKSLGELKDYFEQGTALLLHRSYPGLVTEEYRVVLLDFELISSDSRSTAAASGPNSGSRHVYHLTIQDTQRASPRPPKAKGAKALSIGINSTELGPEWALEYAVADAKRFTNCLTRFRAGDVHTITDMDEESGTISRDNILREFGWLFEDARSDDMLVLFISGHCDFDKLKKVVSLISVGGDPKHILIPSTLFSSYFEKLPPGCTVEVVLDCCHSAGLIRLPEVKRMKLSDGANAGSSSAASKPTGETSTTLQRPPAPGGARGGVCHSIAQLICPRQRQERAEVIQMGLKAPHVSRPVESVLGEPSMQPQPHTTFPPLRRSLVGEKAESPACNTIKANVTVWAATGVGQKAYESSGVTGEPTNGILTNAICGTIESAGHRGFIKRHSIWDVVCQETRLENNNNGNEQQPRILSSQNNPETTMNGFAFKVEET